MARVARPLASRRASVITFPRIPPTDGSKELSIVALNPSLTRSQYPEPPDENDVRPTHRSDPLGFGRGSPAGTRNHTPGAGSRPRGQPAGSRCRPPRGSYPPGLWRAGGAEGGPAAAHQRNDRRLGDRAG